MVLYSIEKPVIARVLRLTPSKNDGVKWCCQNRKWCCFRPQKRGFSIFKRVIKSITKVLKQPFSAQINTIWCCQQHDDVIDGVDVLTPYTIFDGLTIKS
jgi:hypothetical protein